MRIQIHTVNGWKLGMVMSTELDSQGLKIVVRFDENLTSPCDFYLNDAGFWTDKRDGHHCAIAAV